MKLYACYVEAALSGQDEDVKRMCLEDLQAVCGKGPWEYNLQVCPACGQLTWTESKPADEEAYVLDYQDRPGYAAVACDDCQKAYPRNPELFNLVRHMIEHALYVDKRNAKEAK